MFSGKPSGRNRSRTLLDSGSWSRCLEVLAGKPSGRNSARTCSRFRCPDVLSGKPSGRNRSRTLLDSGSCSCRLSRRSADARSSDFISGRPCSLAPAPLNISSLLDAVVLILFAFIFLRSPSHRSCFCFSLRLASSASKHRTPVAETSMPHPRLVSSAAGGRSHSWNEMLFGSVELFLFLRPSNFSSPCFTSFVNGGTSLVIKSSLRYFAGTWQ